MAKKFVDGDEYSDTAGLAIQDGAALDLTSKVRIIYDDTTPVGELIAAMRHLAGIVGTAGHTK